MADALNIYSDDTKTTLLGTYTITAGGGNPSITSIASSIGISIPQNANGFYFNGSIHGLNDSIKFPVLMGNADGYFTYPEPQAETVTGFYLDGTEYKIGGDIAWGNISGTLSDQTDLNTALSGKADKAEVLTKTNTTAFTPSGDYNPATKKYVDDTVFGHVQSAIIKSASEPERATEGRLWYDTTNDLLKAYDGSVWKVVTVDNTAYASSWNGDSTHSPSKDAVYDKISAMDTTIAGKQNTLSTQTAYTSKGSATKVPQITTNSLGQVTGITEVDIQAGETYNAGEGIEIGDNYSAMRGPAPDGFHVPLNTEWQSVYDIWTTLGGGSSDGTNFGIALKLPFAGYRSYSSADVLYQGNTGYYWSSSRYNANSAYRLYFYSTALNPQNSHNRANGFSVRCFKNSPTVPTSSWTKLYGTSIEAGGIFWSSADGLISLSSDGQTWITISDKNLGATQVWNDGDTVSEANCGKYYQRGNNYGFPRTGSVTTSSTQVDASNYGPGNYYSSSTFITRSSSPYRWDTTDNGNLWGGETGIITLDNVITNTGVLSVNGQTGNVVLSAGDMSYSDFGWQAKTGATITLDLASTYTPSADFTVNAPATIKDGQTYILRVNNESTAYTMTLGTNVTNPFGTDITLTDYGIDQFVFLAIGGNLELQPEGGGGGGAITADTTGTTTSISKIWVGTEAEYQALGTYEENVAYMTY